MHQHTVPELKDMAKALGIEGADKMKKAELIEAIESAGPGPVMESAPEISKSSSESLDYANHPKFHKFNSKGAN